jgi:2-polyprenyl-3-methyl-5-hydroxy-6-metoxy-1,4-benzoquinol methylase
VNAHSAVHAPRKLSWARRRLGLRALLVNADAALPNLPRTAASAIRRHYPARTTDSAESSAAVAHAASRRGELAVVESSAQPTLCVTSAQRERITGLYIDAGQSPTLPITGERTVPGVWHENYWFRRHQAVYVAIMEELAGVRVLDAGCGEGYGAAMLAAGGAERVVAIDCDAGAAVHVRRSYPDLAVVRGNLVALPFGDDAYDAVVSLQTIEHLWDQAAFLAECRRVLRPTGRLILSTPNRLTFPPGNPFHSRELSPDELVGFVRRHGRLESLRGLRHGPRLDAWERWHGSIVDAQLATPPEAWTSALAAQVRTVDVDDFVLSADDLDGCLDLVATVGW